MNIYCFAGPNGSGKSTIIDKFLRQNCLEKIEFVNADIIAKTQFPDIKDYNEQNLLAARFAEIRRHQLLAEKKDFIFETVLSTPKNLEFLQKAKDQGANINLVYVLTRDKEINVSRVKQRVKEGGHDVPEDKIRSRYDKCISILPEVVKVSDTTIIYDNSKNYYTSIIIRKNKQNKITAFCDTSDAFCNTHIIKPIKLTLPNVEIKYFKSEIDFNNLFNLQKLDEFIKLQNEEQMNK
ncbi:MAG: zeta toxin family protein [Clostridia bacterium]|nr:zeta toxin family protein [Clostridia bacterium]